MNAQPRQPLSPDVLALDYEAEADRICARLREVTARKLHKRGLVVAVSGGIDSSTCLGLAVRALGANRVFALIMPERDSADDSALRAKELLAHLGVQYAEQDIAATLEAIGCYRWRDEAVRRTVPEFAAGWKFKIVISGGVEGRVNVFHIVAHSPEGQVIDRRLGLQEYLAIVAATNFKQRIRKTLEYFHADRLNYAVVGTPNLLEYDQGFFVKNGDGSADVKPIAHLYKTQVYAMAAHLGLPARVVSATPTTDTYSLPQGQDEFYFALPYAQMDLALWALNHGRTPEELAEALGIPVERARAVYTDIDTKRRTTQYLHMAPVLMDKPGIG
ncbi:MAG TPA: NAD(+) synthase [Steroidobacteraceae bacterium]